MTGEYPFFVVDAFTETRFRGNPAGVVVLDAPIEAADALAIAREVNHPETAFVRALAPGRYELRWFTPTVEMDLCGHVTLATTAALVEELGDRSDSISFETRSGTLLVHRDSSARAYVLNFPANPPRPIDVPAEILSALGLARAVRGAVRKKSFLIVEVDSQIDLPTISPDFSALEKIPMPQEAHGVIVTRRGPEPFDFTSRMFAPWIGIPEDPVTGAAHTVLGPYWGEALGKSEMVAYQASARGGEMRLRWHGDRIDLLGRAVVTIRGRLAVRS